MNDEQRIANNARLSETEAQLAEVVQKYKEYQNMLEPFLGRVDLSDAEKEAIARIETLMAQAAQERDNLRKEQLALIQNDSKEEAEADTEGKRRYWGMDITFITWQLLLFIQAIYSVQQGKDAPTWPKEFAAMFNGLFQAFIAAGLFVEAFRFIEGVIG